MLWSILSVFDLFRLPIVLYFNGTSKRGSILGLLSSFIIYIYLFFSFFQSNLYLKQNPIVVVQTLQNQHAEAMHFDKNKFIGFGLSDVYNNRVVDPSIYNIVVRYFHNVTYFENLELKICDLDDVHGNQTFYDLYSLQYVFCLKNRSFFLEGTIDENARYLAVSLFICNNLTSNNTCKTQAFLDNFFNSFTSTQEFSVVYDDVQVNVDDYTEPFKKLNKVEWQLVDPAVKKRTISYFKKASVVTDSGWLFPNLETKSTFQFETKEFDFQIRQNQNQPVFQYIFFSSKDEIRYVRRYQTIAEFLGGFAGVAKLISMVCAIFVNNFIYIDTLKHILNKIYSFPPYANKKPTKKKIKKIKKKTKSIDLTLSKEHKTIKSPLQEFGRIDKVKDSQHLGKDLDIDKTPNHLKSETLENHLFTKEEEVCNEVLNNIPIHTPNALKKKLRDDSFVLEHFSERSHTEKDKSVTSKPKTINETEIPTFTKTGPDLEQKIHEAKLSEIQNSLLVDPRDKLNSEKKKQKFKERIISFFKKNKTEETENQLKMSYWEYISLAFDVFKSKKSLRHRLIRKAEKTYEEDLDVVSLVRKLHDLDKLKILLLDEDQLVLFNYISKPMINVDLLEKEADESLSVSQRRLTRLINREKNAKLYLEESYRKVFEKKDKISEKLIEFVDKEIYKLGNINIEKK